VVEVPVRIDRGDDWRIARHRVQPLLECRKRALHEGVDDDLAFLAVAHDDIPARPGEHRHHVRQRGLLNGHGGHLRARRGERIRGGCRLLRERERPPDVGWKHRRRCRRATEDSCAFEQLASCHLMTIHP
jgi:hypothetical protein